MMVFKDKEGNRITLADLGVTWISDSRLAELGLTEVDENYQTPIPDSVLLANAKTLKENEIKSLLSATDYKCLKYVDGLLTAEEYSSVKTYREALRNAYNEVEAALTVSAVEAVVIPNE